MCARQTDVPVADQIGSIYADEDWALTRSEVLKARAKAEDRPQLVKQSQRPVRRKGPSGERL